MENVKTWTFVIKVEFLWVYSFFMKNGAFFRDIHNLFKTWTLFFDHLYTNFVSKIATRMYFKCSGCQKVYKWRFSVKTWTFLHHWQNFQNSNFDRKLKIEPSDFVEYSTGRIEISARRTKIFEISRMSRYVLHLQTFENIEYSLKSRPIPHFEISTSRFFGTNSSFYPPLRRWK